ncbi:hypothetical protein F0562_001254 [Nyssa sinensis]|uniref:Uncharacterized protein n=1 Tax=Nyssa sinensis TaxID=561372 RepID=A0A5J5C367_9ASTE|nr:hypothetical protein F0562_001254 [Nyssa sinensis]
MASNETPSNDQWFFDSGATYHITSNVENLHQPEEYNGIQKVAVGDASSLPISPPSPPESLPSASSPPSPHMSSSHHSPAESLSVAHSQPVSSSSPHISIPVNTHPMITSLNKMAAPNNVELEAAKFLHKLIQEPTDEPIKLATKLYVILQHMKSSGKENSMPYQAISRAMETVINQHGLDIEVLKSSRLPLTGGTHMGDSSSSQFAGSSQTIGIMKDSKASLAENEMAKIDSHASNRPLVGPSGTGQNMYQGSVTHLGSKSLDHESPSSFDTRSTNSQSQERRDTPNWDKVNQKDNKKANNSKRKRTDSLSITEPHIDKPQQLDTHNLNTRKGKVVNKVKPPGKLFVESGEHGHSNMVESSWSDGSYPINIW